MSHVQRLAAAVCIAVCLAAAGYRPIARAQEPSGEPVVSGVWTALANQPGVAVTNCLLLTEGTVFCQGYGSRNWYKLTPDNTGSYINGTWSTMAQMPAGYAPLYFASAVLPDGRVIVEGGEYDCTSGCVANWQNKGAIYDPLANSWGAMSPPTGWTHIGDAMAVVLADGRFMLSDATSVKTAILDAKTLTYTAFGTGKINNYNNEEGWTLLPDGSLLTVDTTPAASTVSERFIPGSAMWVTAGSTGVSLADNAAAGRSFEIGPGVLRPDGTVFYIGANPNITSPCCTGFAHTGIFTTGTNLWTAGPDIPNHDAANDAPAAVLPNGNVLMMVAPPASAGNVFGTPSRYYEFDGSAITQVNIPAACGASCNFPSFIGGMLVLPTGEVLLTLQSSTVLVYTPNGSPNAGWLPTIGAVPSHLHPRQHYFAMGTQFNGLTQGAYYGDDLQAATNFPVVQITNTATGHKVFARTHDHSSMGVATGNTPVSTTFVVPPSAEAGASTLRVIANGIASAAVPVSIQGAGGTKPGDFDADGRYDRTVFRPSAGVWYSALSNGGATGTGWGISTDIDVAGDYDGDGKADPTVFRPSTGQWLVLQSTTGTVRMVNWGTSGDIPVAGDMDGDGKNDFIIWRPSTGTWHINLASGGGTTAFGWGTSGDQPLLSDFDGDGKSDIAVFRASAGAWYVVNSGGGTSVIGWGTTGDIPVPGDFDGDGLSDAAVYRPGSGTWYIRNSGGGSTIGSWGVSGDIPIAGDHDGDGRHDLIVWRPSTGVWFTQYAIGGSAAVAWGTTGDKPIGRVPGS